MGYLQDTPCATEPLLLRTPGTLMDEKTNRAVRAALLQLLRQIRHEAGLRQEDLAERLGRPQSFVSKYETGERGLDVLELYEVCVACGVTLARFAGRLERLLHS
jgi:ribosome-binding protein aMBF1 (putative translation factor)